MVRTGGRIRFGGYLSLDPREATKDVLEAILTLHEKKFGIPATRQFADEIVQTENGASIPEKVIEFNPTALRDLYRPILDHLKKNLTGYGCNPDNTFYVKLEQDSVSGVIPTKDIFPNCEAPEPPSAIKQAFTTKNFDLLEGLEQQDDELERALFRNKQAALEGLDRKAQETKKVVEREENLRDRIHLLERIDRSEQEEEELQRLTIDVPEYEVPSEDEEPDSDDNDFIDDFIEDRIVTTQNVQDFSPNPKKRGPAPAKEIPQAKQRRRFNLGNGGLQFVDPTQGQAGPANLLTNEDRLRDARAEVQRCEAQLVLKDEEIERLTDELSRIRVERIRTVSIPSDSDSDSNSERLSPPLLGLDPLGSGDNPIIIDEF